MRKLRAGMKVRITEGHGDTNGATGTLIRTGPRRQWWVELDEPWSKLRRDGLTWVWDSEMEPVNAPR